MAACSTDNVARTVRIGPDALHIANVADVSADLVRSLGGWVLSEAALVKVGRVQIVGGGHRLGACLGFWAS